MSAPALQPRLNYLTDAAHLLACTAPGASAYLMTQRRKLTSRHDIPVSDIEKQHVCAACGNIFIPGCNSILKIESDKALRQRRQLRLKRLKPQGGKASSGQKSDETPRRAGITKKMSCESCGRTTPLWLPPPPAVGRPRRSKPPPAGRSGAIGVADAPKPSANAVSKKRAKNRKAGLQSLLAESRASKASSGLTLANFMKK